MDCEDAWAGRGVRISRTKGRGGGAAGCPLPTGGSGGSRECAVCERGAICRPASDLRSPHANGGLATRPREYQTFSQLNPRSSAAPLISFVVSCLHPVLLPLRTLSLFSPLLPVGTDPGGTHCGGHQPLSSVTMMSSARARAEGLILFPGDGGQRTLSQPWGEQTRATNQCSLLHSYIPTFAGTC